jgi:hypothetical protein
MAHRPATVKKTYNLPPDLVARARRILRAKTETEAIIRSLEQVSAGQEIERAIRKAGSRLPAFGPLR